jgi:hypothetical protein
MGSGRKGRSEETKKGPNPLDQAMKGGFEYCRGVFESNVNEMYESPGPRQEKGADLY